jgi:hypothetical protein
MVNSIRQSFIGLHLATFLLKIGMIRCYAVRTYEGKNETTKQRTFVSTCKFEFRVRGGGHVAELCHSDPSKFVRAFKVCFSLFSSAFLNICLDTW